VGTKGLKHPLKRAEPKSGFGVFLERHGRTILGLFVLALVVHDVFGRMVISLCGGRRARSIESERTWIA